MGLFDKLKQTVAAARSGEVDLSAMSPEQRAAYEERMRQVDQQMAQGHAGYEAGKAVTEQARLARVFTGSAAAYLYGEDHDWYPPPPAELERIRRERGMRAMIAASQPPGGFGFGKALRETVGTRTGPPEIDDPQQRVQVAAAERAARDTARAPYRAPHVAPMTISRLATRGDSQVEEVLEFLRRSGFAARPDLVFGVYRVPDRISPTLSTSSERGRLVEWDVVHVPASLPPAPADAVAAFFPSRQRWVARRVGEPTLLDEDIGRAYMHYAGLGPQHCLGMARMLHLRSGEREDSTGIETWVEGLHVFHVPGPRSDTLEKMTAAAPMVLDLDHLPSTYTEVLDWAEIALIVQPAAQQPPRVPNPIPSLPSTPQELLRAYLEVVGVMPTDCWSAQATVTVNHALSSQSGMISHNLGPKLPCADGKERSRLHGTQHVVIAYLDRPEYVEGRARWAAYQRDVLQARLTDASDRRARVAALVVDSPAVRAVLAPFRALEWLDELGTAQPPPFYRYCWPPVDA